LKYFLFFTLITTSMIKNAGHLPNRNPRLGNINIDRFSHNILLLGKPSVYDSLQNFRSNTSMSWSITQMFQSASQISWSVSNLCELTCSLNKQIVSHWSYFWKLHPVNRIYHNILLFPETCVGLIEQGISAGRFTAEIAFVSCRVSWLTVLVLCHWHHCHCHSAEFLLDDWKVPALLMALIALGLGSS